MPRCPDGHDTLRPLIENSIEGASCETCRGIWLPGAIVQAA
ncbi:MAG: zf-TFIIB domain-containing protein, partial [Planctomycetes bacterium]|nr:zf-TFIIB domain-containing protein [Planctomycetota bacterium]